MITDLLTADNTPILKIEDIAYRREHSYCYGISYFAEIGVESSHLNIKIGDSFKINYDLKPSSILILQKVYKKNIGLDIIEIYVFMDKLNFDISNNLLLNTRKLFSFDLSEYITERDNQLLHIIFNLRKRSLILVNENHKPKHKHIQELLHIPTKEIELSYFKTKELEGDLKRLNYYTILPDGSTPRTKKGESVPKYIPFATREHIRGLDNYLTPKWELITSSTDYFDIGKTVKLGDSLYVVMEEDIFSYKEQVTTTIVLGDKKKGTVK